MDLQYSKNSINKNNNRRYPKYFSISRKIFTKKEQNEYLNKYHNLYGNSFSDVELLDIFAKNNYNDEKIEEDIKNLLSFGNNNNLDKDIDEEDDEFLPSFGPNFNSNKKNNKNDNTFTPCSIKIGKKIFQKNIDFSSDYISSPKDKDINKINNKSQDLLIEYKKDLFKKLKEGNYSYKPSKNKKDEINFDDDDEDDFIKNKIQYYSNNNHKGYKNFELNKKKHTIKNKSVCLEYSYFDEKKKSYINENQNINNEIKKKYMKIFFGNLKNYSKNNKRKKNLENSPVFGKRKNISDINLKKIENNNNNNNNNKKVYTYKKAIKNDYFKKKDSYKQLKVESRENNIFISACYNNPQRDFFLKIINEKKKQNPDKIIEFLLPQYPMMSSIPFYSNAYRPYNQYNPYMNSNMINYPPNFPNQNIKEPNSLFNLIGSQNIHISAQMNNILNQNSVLNNTYGKNNHLSSKSSGNVSNNSGNINTTSSFKN